MGHGDHWEAVEKDYENFVGEMLPRICQSGTLVGKNAFTHTLDEVSNKTGVVYGLQYLEPPLNIMGLVVSGGEENSNELWSSYPVCAEGISSRVVIDEVKPWESGIEGTIKGHFPEGGMVFFFDPYFFLNKDRYQVGEEVAVTLGALAYTLYKVEQLELNITEGPLLEMHRQKLLEGDPTTDVSSITSVPLSMDGAAIYFPRGEDKDDAEIRFQVEEASRFTFAERPFTRLTGAIARPESGEVKIHVYASEQVLDGYMPQVGDNVEALVWMQGFLPPYRIFHENAYIDSMGLTDSMENQLSETRAAFLFARVWNRLALQDFPDCLATDAHYTSQWIIKELQSKKAVSDYLGEKVQEVKDRSDINPKNKIFAELGKTADGPDGRDCVFIARGMKENITAVALFGVDGEKIKRIDLYIPQLFGAVRTGVYPI